MQGTELKSLKSDENFISFDQDRVLFQGFWGLLSWSEGEPDTRQVSPPDNMPVP